MVQLQGDSIVSKSRSFHTVKDEAWNLLVNPDLDVDTVLEKITALFLKDTIPIRDGRSFERKRFARRSHNYEKRVRKTVY